jgi:hypothetical protein
MNQCNNIKDNFQYTQSVVMPLLNEKEMEQKLTTLKKTLSHQPSSLSRQHLASNSFPPKWGMLCGIQRPIVKS